jgi:hypothetical protein
VIFVFLNLAYITEHDDLQLHPFSCKWYYITSFFFFLFFFSQYYSLNLGLCACLAGALPAESCLQPFFTLVIFQIGYHIFCLVHLQTTIMIFLPFLPT